MTRTLTVVAMVAVLLVPLIPAGAGQLTTEADLAITQVTPGDPAVGAHRPIQATVTNHGPSTALDASVVFYWQDTDTPINGTVGASRAPAGDGTLGPGESATARFDWEPRTAQAGAGMVVAVAETGDNTQDPDPDNDQDQASTFVTLPGVDVEPSWGTEVIEVDPGADHPLVFNVTNHGNTEATFVPKVTLPDDTNWTLRVSPAQAELLPGQEARFVLTAQPSEQAPAGETLDAETGLDIVVEQEGYADSGLGQDRPVIPVLQVASQRALTLEATGDGMAKPGVPITGQATVTNVGNTQETVTLSRSASQSTVPAWWNLTFGDPDAELAPGQVLETTFQLNLTQNATAGDHRLVLVASGTGGNPPVALAESTVTVEQIHGVDLDGRTVELALLPGQEGSFEMDLNNTGNGNDTLELFATRPDQNWTLEAQPNRTTLGPGEGTPARLAVTPPPGHSPEDGFRLTAKAVTDGGEDRATDSVDLTVDILEGPHIRAEDVPSAPKVDPEHGTSLSMTLVNTGNQAGTATVDAEAPEGWGVSLGTREADLAPLESRPLTVTLTAPQGAQPGDAADIRLTVANQGDGAETTEVLPAVVGGPDLGVRFDQVPDQVPTGTVQDVTVEVDSQGLKDAPATDLVLTARGDDGTETIARWDIDALATGTSTNRTTAWNTTGWTGTVILTAEVDPGGDIVEEASNNDAATRSVFLSTTQIALSTPPPVDVDPGQTVRLTTPPLALEVTNSGNDAGRFQVSVTDEGGWIDETTQVSLDPGASSEIPITFTVPRPAGRVIDNVTVEAAPADDPSKAIQATWTLSVRDLAPPRVLDVDLDPPPTWGLTARYPITWDDGTGIRGGSATIQGPDQATSEVPIEVTDDVLLAWQPQAAGTHEIQIHLEDLAGNSAPSPPIEVNVTPPDPPSITLPDQGPLAPGDPIKTNLTAAADLETVVVHTQGTRTELTDPYWIDTTGWSEGTHEIRVVANDTLGQGAEVTGEVTIDATPPTLASASAEPSRPGAGDEVTARASFDEPVDEVRFLLVTDDGRRISKTADQVSQTTWEATFAMPEEAVAQVDVQAIDLAGNAVLHEAAIDLETNSAIPGVHAWVVLVVTALGALVARRGPAR